MKTALQSYIEGLVGGQFTVQITNPTVSTTSTKLVGNNFERMAVTFVNTGSVSAVLLPAQNVTTTMGIILGAAGGSLSMNAHDDLALVGWEWFAVGNGGSPTFLVVEILRYNPSGGSPSPGGNASPLVAGV